MGNILYLCLHKNVFNTKDPVLNFAVQQSLSRPSGYIGYHLLHYLLCYALQQTPTFNQLLLYADHQNLYDFSIVILEWQDQEGIVSPPCQHCKHALSE